MPLRRSLALEVIFLLAGPPTPPRAAVLGVVVYAHGAHLSTGAVSAGATVYDGDRFSTEAAGALRVRGEASLLDLAEEGAMILRCDPNMPGKSEAELTKGTLAFSVARAAALEIETDEARIRPAAEAPTVGQVSVTGPKELRVYARRGPLEISYRGETETIAEGKSYRVILDPREDDPRNEPSAKRASRGRRAILLLAISAAAAASVPAIHEMFESPDRP